MTNYWQSESSGATLQIKKTENQGHTSAGLMELPRSESPLKLQVIAHLFLANEHLKKELYAAHHTGQVPFCFGFSCIYIDTHIMMVLGRAGPKT